MILVVLRKRTCKSQDGRDVVVWFPWEKSRPLGKREVQASWFGQPWFKAPHRKVPITKLWSAEKLQ